MHDAVEARRTGKVKDVDPAWTERVGADLLLLQDLDGVPDLLAYKVRPHDFLSRVPRTQALGFNRP